MYNIFQANHLKMILLKCVVHFNPNLEIFLHVYLISRMCAQHNKGLISYS